MTDSALEDASVEAGDEKKTSSSDSLDPFPRGQFGGTSSASTSEDGESAMGIDGSALDVALAKLPLATRAKLVAAAKSSKSTRREELESWSRVTELDVALIEQVFANFAPKSRASAVAARDVVTRIAAADGAQPEQDEYDAQADAQDDDDDRLPSSSASPMPELIDGEPFPGITRDVFAKVTCGDMTGVLELRAGYRSRDERVRTASGDYVTPSKFESDAGRGSAKKWRISLRLLLPNGRKGETVGEWIDRNRYHPKGFVVGGEKEDKPPKAPPVSKSAPRSAFEIQLDLLLDPDGDIEIRSIAKFVRMMRETTKPKERSLMLQVIRGTKNKECLRVFGQDDNVKGLDVLQDWMEDSKRKFQSTLLVSILRTLKLIPVTLEALTRTSIGAKLSKLKSYEVPEGHEEFDNTEMNNKVVALSKSVKNTWKEQITAPHSTTQPPVKPLTTSASTSTARPAVAAVPAKAAPTATTAPVPKAVELKDDDLFGGASKPVTAASKTTVVKTVTKITMERKVAAPSVTTKKPSVSVNDLLKTSTKSTKIAAPLVKAKPEVDDAVKEDATGKKRKRKSVTWAPDDELEQVRVFEKDAKRPKDVAFPDPVRDGDDAESKRALEMRDKEVEAERKAAAKQHQRRLDEMRASVNWRPPKRIPRVGEQEGMAPGAESEEFERMLRVEAEKPSVRYANVKDIPDTPAEAPNEDDQLDLDNTPAFFMEFQEEELSQQMFSPPLPSPVVPMVQPGLALPPNIDFAALSALIANVQQSAAGAPPPPVATFAPPPAAKVYPPPPPPPQMYAPQPPYQPGVPQPPQVPKQATVGGAPVPVQASFTHNGKAYRGVCAFFNTPRGCNWGDKCGYLHESGVVPPAP